MSHVRFFTPRMRWCIYFTLEIGEGRYSHVPLYADFPIRDFHRYTKLAILTLLATLYYHIFWSFLTYLHNTLLVNGKLDVDGYKTGADPGYSVGGGTNPPWEGTNLQILPKTA